MPAKLDAGSYGSDARSAGLMVKTLLELRNSVCPSGGAWRSAEAPMSPPARAGSVVDDDGCAQLAAKVTPNRAGNHVRAAACGEWNHDGVRPGLGHGKPGKCRKSSSDQRAAPGSRCERACGHVELIHCSCPPRAPRPMPSAGQPMNRSGWTAARQDARSWRGFVLCSSRGARRSMLGRNRQQTRSSVRWSVQYPSQPSRRKRKRSKPCCANCRRAW
jgi:hypothetical protein